MAILGNNNKKLGKLWILLSIFNIQERINRIRLIIIYIFPVSIIVDRWMKRRWSIWLHFWKQWQIDRIWLTPYNNSIFIPAWKLPCRWILHLCIFAAVWVFGIKHICLWCEPMKLFLWVYYGVAMDPEEAFKVRPWFQLKIAVLFLRFIPQTVNSSGSQSVLHINSILEVMQIFLNARSKSKNAFNSFHYATISLIILNKKHFFVVIDNSLKKMLVTMLNFALSFLKLDDCTAQVLETANCVFVYGKPFNNTKIGFFLGENLILEHECVPNVIFFGQTTIITNLSFLCYPQTPK